MKHEIYAVRDSAVGAFNRTLFFRSRGEAIRSFSDAVAKEENGFSTHAGHYDFWYLGYFDDDTGAVVAAEPDRIGGALDFLLPAGSGP